jgi:hypothetical protein
LTPRTILSDSRRRGARRYWSSRVTALLLLGAVLAGFTECTDQPAPQCITSPAPFAVRLSELSREESAPGSCDEFGLAGFNADPEVGVEPYYARDSKGQPDYDRGSIAMQTAEVGDLVFTAEAYGVENEAMDGTRYSEGAFTAKAPDANGYCYVPTLSDTHVVLPELPAVDDDPDTDDDESFPGQPAVDIRLAWSKFRVYVTAAYYGTQFEAELRDTRMTDAGDSCTIVYHAVGLSPAVPCMAFDPDSGDPVFDDAGNYVLDPSACAPEADPAHDRPTGSGISPGTRYVCDPATAYCLLDGNSVPAIH